MGANVGGGGRGVGNEGAYVGVLFSLEGFVKREKRCTLEKSEGKLQEQARPNQPAFRPPWVKKRKKRPVEGKKKKSLWS